MPTRRTAPNDAMDPVIEATHQPLCHALAGWKFTLGTGYQVAGPSRGRGGTCSKVTGAYADAPRLAQPGHDAGVDRPAR